jgi:hypothetical protein
LAYAALVAVAYGLADLSVSHTPFWSGVLATTFSIAVLATGLIGVAMVWDLQRWMARLRQSVSEAEGHFSQRYQQIAGSIHGGGNYHSVFYRSMQAWLITFVMAVGWSIATAIVIVKFVAR